VRTASRRACLAALVGLVFAATGGCGAIIGLEAPFAESADDGDGRADDVVAQADTAVDDAPHDASVDTEGTRRVECLQGNLVHLDSSESLGAPPSFGGNAGYLFGIVVDQRSADDVDAYVSIGNDYNGGAGRIYRITNDSPTWELFAETPSVSSQLQIASGYLFAGETSSVVRFRLDCPSPCTAEETATPAGLEPIDAFWAVSPDLAFVVPNSGALLRLSRSASGWASDEVGAIDAPAFYRSAAATDRALYVAQIGFPAAQAFPFGADAGPTPRLDPPSEAGSPIVLADCDRVYLTGDTTFSFDPTTGIGHPIGSGASLYGRGIDENFIYVGLPNGGGFFRYRKDGMADASEALSQNISVWGIGLSPDWIYYGEHGFNTCSGDAACPTTAALFRRRKTP